MDSMHCAVGNSMFSPIMELALSLADRRDLEALTRSTTGAAGLVRRARCILLLADGHSYSVVATRLGVTDRFISMWKKALPRRRGAGAGRCATGGPPRSSRDTREDRARAASHPQSEAAHAPHPLDRAPSRGHRRRDQRGQRPRDLAARRVAVFHDRRGVVHGEPGIRTSRRRRSTSSGCTSPPQRMPWCSASMRKRRSRRSIGRSRCCPWGPIASSGRVSSTAPARDGLVVRCARGRHGARGWTPGDAARQRRLRSVSG